MIAEGLEKRMPFRRVMKSMVEKVMACRDVQGVRIFLSGRLGGAEMARCEDLKKGQFHFKHSEQILISNDTKLIYHTETSVLKYGFIQVSIYQISILISN